MPSEEEELTQVVKNLNVMKDNLEQQRLETVESEASDSTLISHLKHGLFNTLRRYTSYIKREEPEHK